MKIKPITEEQVKSVLCSDCSGLLAGVQYRIKRNRAVITKIPKEKRLCPRCLEERLAA